MIPSPALDGLFWLHDYMCSVVSPSLGSLYGNCGGQFAPALVGDVYVDDHGLELAEFKESSAAAATALGSSFQVLPVSSMYSAWRHIFISSPMAIAPQESTCASSEKPGLAQALKTLVSDRCEGSVPSAVPSSYSSKAESREMV